MMCEKGGVLMKTLKPLVAFSVMLLLAAGAFAQPSNVAFTTGVPFPLPGTWCPILDPAGAPLAPGSFIGLYSPGPDMIVDPPDGDGLPTNDDFRYLNNVIGNGTQGDDHLIMGFQEAPFVPAGNMNTGNGAVIIDVVGTGVEPFWNQGERGYLRAFNGATPDVATHYNDLMTVGGAPQTYYMTTTPGPATVIVCFGEAIALPGGGPCVPMEEGGPEAAVIAPGETHYFFGSDCTLWITAGDMGLNVTATLFDMQPPCPPFAGTMYMTRYYDLEGVNPPPESFFDVFFGYSQADYDASDFGPDETLLHVAWYNGDPDLCDGQWYKALPTIVTDTPEGGYAQVHVNHFSIWSFGWDGGDTQLPVELTAFGATPGDRMVVLNWTTASETNNRGFYIERSTDGETFQRVSQLQEGQGNSSTAQEYTYTDNSVANGVHYTYRLVDEDINGNEFVNTQTAEATPSMFGEAVVITEYKLHQNYPNPFNPSTNIVYDVKETGFVTLKVYNVMGQEVATLVNANRQGGHRYAANFDATGLSSGIYFYAVKVNSFSDTKKMLLIQ
jgi:hypothetical protein